MQFNPKALITLPVLMVLMAPCSWAEPDTSASLSDAPAPSIEDTAPKGRLPLEELRTFTRVYEHIRNDYIKEADDATLLKYAIKGMLAELDPHSTYLDASSFEDLQRDTTGEYGGLGIEVGMQDGLVKVISPIDDTPAAKAGIESGDLIAEIDGTPVKGLSLGDAVEMMRGLVGTEIELLILREGEDKPLDITITRDVIKVQSVRWKILEKEYGYLRIAQFQLNTGIETKDAIKGMFKDTPDLKGIILDLRNNPGGLLQASVAAAGAFLDGGLVVYTEGRTENSNNQFHAEPGDSSNGLPVVVLINGGSASASEIVAGALQDHRRAVILGTQSFGKGSVQSVLELNETQAIKLTTALYYTPNGRSIQAQGIAPDIVVERAKVEAIRPNYSRITEADLSGHLDNANGGEEKNSKRREQENNERDGLFSQDNQLFDALNLLKGLNLFGGHRSNTAAESSSNESD